MLPKVVIFGRPNVGKSTLFNRLIKRKAAIVADIPGVTRDNKGLKANLGKLEFILYDTAGFDEIDDGNELSKNITDGTVHLSCWMTMAQIKEIKAKKVLFSEFE